MFSQMVISWCTLLDDDDVDGALIEDENENDQDQDQDIDALANELGIDLALDDDDFEVVKQPVTEQTHLVTSWDVEESSCAVEFAEAIRELRDENPEVATVVFSGLDPDTQTAIDAIVDRF
eukprot:m.396246 g.396246  ORF g.396246 m.396246 type:complete len:121 (+) comp28358_c0_seq3:2752-3114(+)